MNSGSYYYTIHARVVPVLVLFMFFYAPHVQGESEKYLTPQTTILVTPVKPDIFEQKAAKILNKWLRKIYRTDSGFIIVPENKVSPGAGNFIITIGKTRFSLPQSLDSSEPYCFGIERKNDVVSIIGETSTGTLEGVAFFLDHFCGVRFYLPGDLYVSLPESDKIQLDKNINIKEIPFTRELMSTGYKTPQDAEWAQINGLQRKDWGSHQHSMGDRFYNDTIYKLFPDIFPIVKGQRYFPKSKSDQNWEPDFAEPKLVDAAVYSAIQYFKRNPRAEYISFSVQDSWTYPTEGKMGEFLKKYPSTKYGRYRAYTDAYLSFLNKLAGELKKKLPENGITTSKSIVYLVYNNVAAFPAEKLDESILPITVLHLSETLMDSVYNKSLPDDKSWYRLDEWPRATRRVGNDDWAEGRGFIYPRIYTNLISKFLRTVQKNKIKFEYAHLEFYPNWALDGPKYYLMGKMYWNPRVNTDSLLTLFCYDMFGKADKQMADFFRVLENLNTSMNNDPKRHRKIGLYNTQLELNEKELDWVHQARQHIKEACILAQTEKQKARIELFSEGFKISEGFFDLYNSKNADTTRVNGLKNYLKDSVAGNTMLLNIAGDKDFLEKMDKLIDQIAKIRR